MGEQRQIRTRSWNRMPTKRCSANGIMEEFIVVDDDEVIILDFPESSKCKASGSSRTSNKSIMQRVISIDDDDDDDVAVDDETDNVQYLQEKVQKYEGSYPGWTQEPTKLTPWRNNHWRVQSLANHPVAITNGSGPGIPFPGKFEENIVTLTPAIVADTQNVIDSDKGRAVVCKLIESQPEVDDKGLPPVQPIPPSVQGEQANECPATSDGLGQSNDLVIESGTISISSAYSHELLSSLTQALQNAGIDLSQAKLSVQIDLGKRASQGVSHEEPSSKNPLASGTQARAPSVEEESEHSHKRMRTH